MLGLTLNEPPAAIYSKDEEDEIKLPNRGPSQDTTKAAKNYDAESIDSTEAAIQAAVSGE